LDPFVERQAGVGVGVRVGNGVRVGTGVGVTVRLGTRVTAILSPILMMMTRLKMANMIRERLFLE
jgi:hypothetical protein